LLIPTIIFRVMENRVLIGIKLRCQKELFMLDLRSDIKFVRF